MSQSASALHEQLSSHFFKSSHNLKFFSSFLKSFFIVDNIVSSCIIFSNCYPLCHMNTSCNSCPLVFDVNSSSNVTIFSRVLGGIFLGILVVSGSIFGTTSLPVTDKSNSLTLLGTKYSINGSAPKTKKKTTVVIKLVGFSFIFVHSQVNQSN